MSKYSHHRPSPCPNLNNCRKKIANFALFYLGLTFVRIILYFIFIIVYSVWGFIAGAIIDVLILGTFSIYVRLDITRGLNSQFSFSTQHLLLDRRVQLLPRSERSGVGAHDYYQSSRHHFIPTSGGSLKHWKNNYCLPCLGSASDASLHHA